MGETNSLRLVLYGTTVDDGMFELLNDRFMNCIALGVAR